jgi:ubiquinone/menaquinone biosynthesis C-methylase UbiE
MGKQEIEFLRNEADAWFSRNKDKPYIDHVGHAIRNSIADISHADILEVGCGRGDGIAHLQASTDGVCIGIDPSNDAIDQARRRFPNSAIFLRGSAMSMPQTTRGVTETFDIIIYDFCLYLCDREDLFEIVAKSDAALNDGGHIVIYDFDPDNDPYCTPYAHHSGLFSFKMNHSRLWLANPAYSLVSKLYFDHDKTSIKILKKNIEAGWPMVELQ